MARLARIVLPDVPHHVTQRGNRRMEIFSEPSDFALYRDLLAERLKLHGVVCSAYCLMPNHVHLLLTPTRYDAASAAASLSRSVGEAHRDYGRDYGDMIPIDRIAFPRQYVSWRG